MEEKFALPGSGGELHPAANIWRKGLVFTKRAQAPEAGPGYRVCVGFKRGGPAAQHFGAFASCTKSAAKVIRTGGSSAATRCPLSQARPQDRRTHGV